MLNLVIAELSTYNCVVITDLRRIVGSLPFGAETTSDDTSQGETISLLDGMCVME